MTGFMWLTLLVLGLIGTLKAVSSSVTPCSPHCAGLPHWSDQAGIFEVMRVVVDQSVCVGSGLCEVTCPDVFEVGMVAEVIQPEPSPNRHDAVRQAADECPTGAIILEE